MKHLAIVWRNPLPRRFERRCLVEELIAYGDRHYWSKTAALEMVDGGRIAA